MEARGPGRSDDEFVEQLAKIQLRLRSYIYTLLRDSTSADDVLQEASVALWKKRLDYDASRDFFRWACGVALIEVLRHRRKTATDKLLFDEALLNTLAAEYVEQTEDWDLRRAALNRCMQKLRTQDRWLLDARYRSGVTVGQIADQLGRPLSTIYSSLTRIRESLYRCVRITLAQETHH
jgi:RNA polymerase sigma-70 factor (ECF subfamily)